MAYRHVLKERLTIKGNTRYAKTFGNMLRDAGYKTAIVGKWQLSERDFQAPFHFGFEEYLLWHFGMRVNGVQTPGSQGSRYWDPVFYHNGKLLSETKGQFGPDVIQKHQAEPFFLYQKAIPTFTSLRTLVRDAGARFWFARFSLMS